MTIVYTPGVWDLFHFGHLQFIRAAALRGDKLVVGVQSDASVKKQKLRAPIIPQEQRAAIVYELNCVDHVIIYDELDHLVPLSQCGADVLVLSNEDQSEHGKLAEKQMWKFKRNTVRILRTPGVSTTDIRQRVFEQEKLR